MANPKDDRKQVASFRRAAREHEADEDENKFNDTERPCGRAASPVFAVLELNATQTAAPSRHLVYKQAADGPRMQPVIPNPNAQAALL